MLKKYENTCRRKTVLPNGRHTVTITDVEEGKSEHKGVPYFNVRFENEDGFVNHRFYQSESGQPIIAEFLKALGLEGEEVDLGTDRQADLSGSRRAELP